MLFYKETKRFPHCKSSVEQNIIIVSVSLHKAWCVHDPFLLNTTFFVFQPLPPKLGFELLVIEDEAGLSKASRTL